MYCPSCGELLKQGKTIPTPTGSFTGFKCPNCNCVWASIFDGFEQNSIIKEVSDLLNEKKEKEETEDNLCEGCMFSGDCCNIDGDCTTS